MFLHAGLVDGDPGQIGARNPTCVGYATQPTMGGGTVPTINIMDRGSTDTYRMLAKVEGPQCFGGCMELCYSSEFSVSNMNLAQLDVPVKLGDMAKIVKRKPQSLEGALREMVTDADVYTLEFNPNARLTAQQKATMLASLILTDYMFFERDNAMCNCDNGLECNVCQMYCYGCIIPCSIKLNQQNSGGGGYGGGGGGGGGFMAD